METLTHKGYTGTIEASVQDEVMFGKLLHINDLVTYEAQTIPELKAAFIESVEDYLATCKELGKNPDKACSGTFNVRVTPELHRQAMHRATADKTSLNAVVSQALEAFLNAPKLHASMYSLTQSDAFSAEYYELGAQLRNTKVDVLSDVKFISNIGWTQ